MPRWPGWSPPRWCTTSGPRRPTGDGSRSARPSRSRSRFPRGRARAGCCWCRTGADNRKNYSGKAKAHGLLFLALTDTHGNLIWISCARPGRTSEITAARHDKLTARFRDAGLGALADLGFVGLDDDPGNPVIITGR